jgi:hypothetical protein
MDESQPPPRFQFGLSELFATTFAIALWLTLWLSLKNNPHIHPLTLPFVLLGVSIALYKLLQGHKFAVPVAAILSPLIVVLVLAIAYLVANR